MKRYLIEGINHYGELKTVLTESDSPENATNHFQLYYTGLKFKSIQQDIYSDKEVKQLLID